ncbi:hypothetical protein DFH28DRAFT_914032 [Melampsora americana]|nr:hypothetical protein DFH28DRAFT_914032 [Melampsora americana]
MPTLIRGPVARSEKSLRESLGPLLVFDIGSCNRPCKHCGALRWGLERTKKNQRSNKDEYSNCCKAGQVLLPTYYFPQPPPPQIILWLLTSPEESTYSFVRLCSLS